MTPPTHDAAARFVRRGLSADGPTAAAVREEFTAWLRRYVGPDETRLCDVVLAVNEALANSAEFAYSDGVEGTCDLDAVYAGGVGGVLTVTVCDRGRWREPDLNHRQRRRGWGIPLMRRLADRVVIDTSTLGTSVCMRFEQIHSLVLAG